MRTPPDQAKAWQKLFRDFNKRNGRGRAGYKRGEKIAIKINLNQTSSSHDQNDPSYTSPHFLLALLRQLVHNGGVDPSDIIIFDPTRYIPNSIYNHCVHEFPGVHFVDWTGGQGREAYQRDLKTRISWSAPMTMDPKGGNAVYLPTCVTQATYMINVAHLRGHILAGVSLCAKNHFGTMCTNLDGQPTRWEALGAGVHPYVAAHPLEGVAKEGRKPATYTPLVDLMGHKDLGGKNDAVRD